MSEKRELNVRYSGRIIEHLTVQTYQSPVAAIAEIVANAWDAEATEVAVSLPLNLEPDAKLVVSDNGIGMTFEQCQDRYLEVGYPRRGNDPSSTSGSRGRPLMGRKGIGKFAGFGIANVMVVDTVSAETGERTVFRLEYERLRGGTDKYVHEEATSIPAVEWYAADDHDQPQGTRIELTNFKLRQRPSPDTTRRSLARRFLLLERAEDFAVKVDDIPIADEQDESGVQFRYPAEWSEDERPEGLTITDDGWGEEELEGKKIRWRVVFYQETIKDEELRGVSVFAHGKLAQRPFFFELGEKGGTEGQNGQQYLSGQVEASFLDEVDEDLISIERQRVDWNHPVADPLLKWGQERLRQLLSMWSKRRVEEKVRQLDDKIARFSSRLEVLPSHERKIVAGAIRNLAKVTVLTDDQFENLSEATLTAWEDGRLKELISEVADSSDMSEKDLLAILMEHQVLTAIHTAEAVKAKKLVVEGLRKRIKEKELENAVRDYIAKNPWLIDPKWETFSIETGLRKLTEESATEFSEEMLRGRVDLVLASGEQLLVLEFMRPGLKLNRDHLSRYEYYVDAIRSRIEANTGDKYATVTGYVVADRIEEDPAIQKKIRSLAADHKYVLEWERLLAQAGAHWQEFFDALLERAPDDPRIAKLREGASPVEGAPDDESQAA
jgi:hypothetical protein